MYVQKRTFTGNAQTLVQELPVKCGVSTILITGTFVATLEFEASVDGTTYVSINANPMPTGVAVTNATAAGTWRIQSSGFRNLRVRTSGYTSGSAVVTINSTEGSY